VAERRNTAKSSKKGEHETDSPAISMKERQKLSDLLQKTYQQSPTYERAKARRYIALRMDEIEEQSQKGWPLRAMWRVLKDNSELTCAYSTFVKHVQALRNPDGKKGPKKKKEFSWNSAPNKEDVI
jgi:hypothetical protein